MSPQCHVIKVSVSTAPILIDVANITCYQCVRGRSSAIAVLYETHWNGNPCAWARKLVFKPFPIISSHTGRINKPIVSPVTENISVCVLTQPGTRSPTSNVKSTSRNLIHSSLVLATVLASYPPLYILKPPVYTWYNSSFHGFWWLGKNKQLYNVLGRYFVWSLDNPGPIFIYLQEPA